MGGVNVDDLSLCVCVSVCVCVCSCVFMYVRRRFMLLGDPWEVRDVDVSFRYM